MRKFQHVLDRIQPQIFCLGADVDKADIKIAVFVAGTPGTAAGFDCVQHMDAVFFFNLLQLPGNQKMDFLLCYCVLLSLLLQRSQ